ncbi:MAG TPA: hypothetical protein VEB68_06530 [Croceibacterium sp.]|nr:hypothetical protein [Croceibacterium sp.]
MRRAALALALAGGAALLSAPAAASDACPRQPVPGLLDAVRPVASVYVTRQISFAASPSLRHPHVGWVVRAYAETAFEGPQREREMLEVLRLQVEHDCNRWFVTGRWEGPLEPGEVARIVAEARPFLEPAAAALSGMPGGYAGEDSLMLDGTGIAVETGGPDWRLRRGGHAHGGAGGAASDLFLGLVARLVPADEMPTREWR